MAIKTVSKDTEELRIAQFLTSIRDPQNHCVPVLEVVPDPLDPQRALLVMPYLRRCNDPDFLAVGELVDFMDQAFEVCARSHPRAPVV